MTHARRRKDWLPKIPEICFSGLYWWILLRSSRKPAIQFRFGDAHQHPTCVTDVTHYPPFSANTTSIPLCPSASTNCAGAPPSLTIVSTQSSPHSGKTDLRPNFV